MGPSARTPLAVLALAMVAFAGCAGCKRPHDEELPPPPPPVDRLKPDELPEGTLKAFGLVLPKPLRIESRGPDNVIAVGQVQREALANYVRARVKDGEATVGAAQTIFTGVRVPTDAARPLEITVSADAPGFARIIVTDSTPPKIPHHDNDEQRLRAVGLTPNGRIADPKHLE
jgi:hypothetical protein